MSSKANLIISGSEFYLEINFVVAAWKGLFSTASYPCSRRTPPVHLGCLLQALSPAMPFLQDPFPCLPSSAPGMLTPDTAHDEENRFSVNFLPPSLPPTLPGVTPHMCLTHTGESIQHPTFHAQVLLASPHYSLSPTHLKDLLYPYHFCCSPQPPLVRNSRFQEGGNIHLYYRHPNSAARACEQMLTR